MQDLHIVLEKESMYIRCANCDARIMPGDAEEKVPGGFGAGYYTCPNCFINIAISQDTAEWGSIGVMQDCADRLEQR